MENTGKNTGHENLIPWKEGDPSPNPNGRPKGQRNYATIYREALIKLAALNDKSPEELEDEIVSSGLLNARKGNYAFYKDVMDRLHGSATQKTDVTSGGEKIQINTISYADSNAPAPVPTAPVSTPDTPSLG